MRIKSEFGGELPPPPFPENNPPSPEKIALGEALFFDPNLSACGSTACASCHVPEEGFSDGRKISKGCGGRTGTRNSNTLYNTAYLSHLFWDGRVQSLEQQALGPVVDRNEMANNWDNVLSYLATGEHPVTRQSFPESGRFYAERFGAAFSGEITSATVARALASYERTLISRDSPFDRWLAGDDTAMSDAAFGGAMIFFGRGRCFECHPPPNFTDSDFHNVAIPKAGFEKSGLFPENSGICGGLADNLDAGRAAVPFLRDSCSDVGKFKTPTLRNIGLTRPYMHNGAFSSLDAVLQHYWNVGRGTGMPLLGAVDPKVRGIRLGSFAGQPEDFANLAAFLQALTGTQAPSPERGIAPPGGSD